MDDEPITITNFRDALPEVAPAKDRVAFVRAGRRKELALDEDALHAAARPLVDPWTAAKAVDNDLLTQELIGPSLLMIVQQSAYLTELLPLVQPRASGAPRNVSPPLTDGIVAEDSDEPGLESADATMVFRFEDEEHLIAQVAQTVRQTLTLGRDYSSSILAKRVSRPVLAHVARIEFESGEGFDITVVRDGLTRVTSCWRTIYPDLTADELAEVIAATLLASKRGRRSDDTETAMRARGRDEQQRKLRAQYAVGMATGTPTEEAIRIGQALIVPVQLVVSFALAGAATVPVEQQFDDAIQALVSSVHGEFEPWDQSASDSVAILRALPRAVHDEHLDLGVAEIASGYRPISDVPMVFGADFPATALWRAVCLVAWLCSPTEFNGIKTHMRELLGISRIERKTYVSHLMTLIDLPWRSTKQHTQQQARRAWNNGGPIPHNLLDWDWTPVATTDFTSLVPKALAGDENARATLQVAGGIALVTDKLLMSNTGSAVAVGEVPFRANVSEVVARLGNSEAGLWLLARAANAFTPDKKAINSFTPQELLRKPQDGGYVVPSVIPETPSAIRMDNTGQPERLTAYEVLAISDPQRAVEAQNAKKEMDKEKKRAGIETRQRKAERLREELSMSLNTAVNTLESLESLGNLDGSLQPILVDHSTWAPLEDCARTLGGKLYILRPPARSPITDDAAVIDDEEDVEDER
ncbi:hypothetical protein [Lentzea sp. NPDC092896]|uniref:hypothetical protein n=1 Tax=Lentzea sp. NPDC092896 TaxID=3364127 RepID=UPI00380451CA